MATANKQEIHMVEVTLTLSGEEAQAIVEVLARVGGPPYIDGVKTLRGHGDDVLQALRDAGFSFTPIEDDDPLMKGHLYYV